MIIAIDPGKNGATVARLDGRIIDIFRHSNVGDIGDQNCAIEDYVAWLYGAYEKNVNDLKVRIFCENVSGRPGNGVRRNWSFAYGTGRIHASVEFVFPDAEWTFVQPKVWMRAMGCQTMGNKNVTKDLATELFPDWHVIHDIADAMLISSYAEMQT